jgi:hypothetical protein
MPTNQILMQDRFRGKTWIYWAQFIIFGSIGVFALVFGITMWTGNFRDANGETKTDGGLPCTAMGIVALVVAALAGFNIVANGRALIRCYRQGIQCHLVGKTSLDDVPFVPNSMRLAWAIVTLQGFRSNLWRAPWGEFQSAEVGGLPMAQVLRIHGTFTNLSTGESSGQISFPQVGLSKDLQEVANVLMRFAKNEASRATLADWKDEQGSAVKGPGIT